MGSRRGSLCTALSCAGVMLALAGQSLAAERPLQPLTAAQQKTLPQVALGKARTASLDAVLALPLTPTLTIADWLADDADLDRAVRLWIRSQPRQGGARLYSDHVCEADICIRPAALRDTLTDILAAHGQTPEPHGVSAATFKHAAQRWPYVWTTGTATPTVHAVVDRPPGWEDVTAEGQIYAERAAVADAQYALFEAAGLLKVTPAHRLREFLDSSPAIADAVREDLRIHSTAKVAFEPDQTAVARVQIDMKKLLRILTRVHEEHYTGDQFAAADFREMTLLATQADLSATGLAPPPARAVLRSSYAPIEFDTPPWVTQSRTATGHFEPPEGHILDETAQASAARLDGLDRLRREIESLEIKNGVTITEFVGYHQQLKDDIVLLLSGARVTGPPVVATDGSVEVPVELPLRRLWEIVRRGMVLEEVEPPDTPAAPMTQAVNAESTGTPTTAPTVPEETP